MKKVLERLKSPVVIAGIAGQILLLVGLFATKEVSDTVKTVLFAVIELLTLFGFVNNPSDKKNF